MRWTRRVPGIVLVLAIVFSAAPVFADPGTYCHVTPASFVAGDEACVIEWDYDSRHDTIITADGPGGTIMIAHAYFGSPTERTVNRTSWNGMLNGTPVATGTYTITVTPNDEWSAFAVSDTVTVVAPGWGGGGGAVPIERPFDWPVTRYELQNLAWAITAVVSAHVGGSVKLETPPINVAVKLTDPPGVEIRDDSTGILVEIGKYGEPDSIYAGIRRDMDYTVNTTYMELLWDAPAGVRYTRETEGKLPYTLDRHFGFSVNSTIDTEVRVKPWVEGTSFAFVAAAVIATLPSIPEIGLALALERLLEFLFQKLDLQWRTASLPVDGSPDNDMVGRDSTVRDAALASVLSDQALTTLAGVIGPLARLSVLTSLDVSPSAYAGQTLTVTGDGFTPNGEMTVAFGCADSAVPPTMAGWQADSLGSLSITIPLDPDAAPGSYLLAVFDETALLSSLRIFSQSGGADFPPTTIGAALVDVMEDRSPPTTVSVLTPAEPDGLEGWYVSPVSIELTALDRELTVSRTLWSVNGGVWSDYEAPIELTDGRHVLSYYSLDAVGNTEDARYLSVAVDCLLPETSHEGPVGWVNVPTMFTISGHDAGSGVAHLSLECTGDVQTIAAPSFTGILTAEGRYTIEHSASDRAGNRGITQEVVLGLDFTPPMVTGAAECGPNEYGWYNAPVKVAFEAVDPVLADGSAGSGVTAVSEPVVVLAEGRETTVQGSAVDAACNVGRATVSLSLDFLPPVIEAALEGGPIYTDTESLCWTVEVADILSSVRAWAVTVDGNCAPSGGPFELRGLPLGQHELAVTAEDYAGNTATVIVPFSTVATLDSLVCLKHQLAALGYFSRAPGVIKSLDAHLEAARRAVKRGQVDVFANTIEAFVREVKAARASRIDPKAADLLLRDAAYLLEHGPGF